MPVIARKLTWDDIKDLPEDAGRTEIVDGDLVVSPSPSWSHQAIATALGAKIYPFVRDNELGRFFSSPVHVVLSKHGNYEPDLCLLSRDRLHLLRGAVIDGPPDLIIEIISDDNRTHDTVVKFRDYERYGVAEYWLVDPRERVIRVYFLEGRSYKEAGAFSAGENVVTRKLNGLALDPGGIFEQG
jgi:Uma2 family endonuclease